MPADFKIETLEAYARLNAAGGRLKVYETYGNLNPSPMASGRAVGSPRLPRADMSTLSEYLRASAALGIEFNYTFNAPCTGGMEFSTAGRRRLLDFFEGLVEAGVRCFTLVTPSLISLVKTQFPHVSVATSTICEIESVAAAKAYAGFGADRIIMSEDAHRRFDLLRRVRGSVGRPIELLVNSTCLYLCPWKPFHYNLLSHMKAAHQPDIEAYYHWQCMAVRASRPIELVKLRWIRPEDLNLYEDATFFKVVGRYFAQDSDLVRVARTYMEGHFDGNLWDLLGNFAPQRRHGFYIDNRALDGFVEWFARDPRRCRDLACDDCAHCREYAERAVRTPSGLVRESLGLDELAARLERFHRHGAGIQGPGVEEIAVDAGWR